jgi:hypothetical protein
LRVDNLFGLGIVYRSYGLLFSIKKWRIRRLISISVIDESPCLTEMKPCKPWMIPQLNEQKGGYPRWWGAVAK